MEIDDQQIGRLLTRRQVIHLFGAGVIASTGATHPVRCPNLPACIVRPEQTEGPFFKDFELHRSDLRVDLSTKSVLPGISIQLIFHVLRVDQDQCTPLSDVKVDLWQCDLNGYYSAFCNRGKNLRKENFLRGYQLTDSEGFAQFTTIFPGWYSGRTVHIHLKLSMEVHHGKAYEFSTQLYFDDALTDHIYSNPPYDRLPERQVRNWNDQIFRRNGGQQLMLDVSPTEAGYTATFPVGLHLPSGN